MTSNRNEESKYDSALHDVLNFICSIENEPDAINLVKKWIARVHLTGIVHSDAK